MTSGDGRPRSAADPGTGELVAGCSGPGITLYRNLVRSLCKQGDDCTKSGTEFPTWE